MCLETQEILPSWGGMLGRREEGKKRGGEEEEEELPMLLVLNLCAILYQC